MFLLVLKLYQMDVAHAVLFARKIYVSRLTVRYLSAKFEILNIVSNVPLNFFEEHLWDIMKNCAET